MNSYSCIYMSQWYQRRADGVSDSMISFVVAREKPEPGVRFPVCSMNCSITQKMPLTFSALTVYIFRKKYSPGPEKLYVCPVCSCMSLPPCTLVILALPVDDKFSHTHSTLSIEESQSILYVKLRAIFRL